MKARFPPNVAKNYAHLYPGNLKKLLLIVQYILKILLFTIEKQTFDAARIELPKCNLIIHLKNKCI